MKRERLAPRVVQFRPRPRELVAIIRRLAADSDNVTFKEHALDRMDERGITTFDALRVLRSGDIVGEIEAGRNPGEWKCKVVERRKGAREIGVATIVFYEKRLYVKTVEWEDL